MAGDAPQDASPATHTASHDADDLDFDSLDAINSQEILDLVLHEERQFATQQQQHYHHQDHPPTPTPPPVQRTNLYPRLTQHIPPTPSTPSGDELQRLRAENTRLRAEHNALQTQLSTRDGEVRIVREHLARTEIDNTQLQEMLAARLAAAAKAQHDAERGLRAEIDRLATALAFHQHDAAASAVVVSRTPARKPPLTRRADHVKHDAFPSLEEFSATPTAAAAGSASQTLVNSPDDDIQLLAILTDLADAQPDARPPFTGLVSVALALARAVRHPSAPALSAFSQLTRPHLCAVPADHAQRSATVLLLHRAVNRLPGFRDAWLSDPGTLAVLDALCDVLRDGVKSAAEAAADNDVSGACAASAAQLLLRVVEMSEGTRELVERVWNADLLSLAPAVASHRVSLECLRRLLLLLGSLACGSRAHAPDLERFLLACVARLRRAFALAEQGMVDAEHAFLVLLASVMTAEASVALITRMLGFARALVAWFLDEHRALTGAPVDPPRVDMFVQFVICLKVVLSEVGDVVELLGGDFDPAFFAFVAACTRMSLGERVFERTPEIRELAADLLAYVVTEPQALSIQSLE